MTQMTLAENLLYSTIKLTAMKNDAAVSYGTGFFMVFATHGDKSCPAIVTNKHVVKNADSVIASFHRSSDGEPSGQFVKCVIDASPAHCVNHPDPDVDLCAIPVAQLLDKAMEASMPFFLRWINKDIIPNKFEWTQFDAIEEVTMIGCPNGISDEVNNFPIVRRGITASALGRDYNGKEEFMVDMACFPGSSGSPVFIYDRNGYLDRSKNAYMMGEQRIFLVGILHAGPQIMANGQLILGQAPKVSVASMMHLGNVIKSSALHAIEAEFLRLAGATPHPEVTLSASAAP